MVSMDWFIEVCIEVLRSDRVTGNQRPFSGLVVKFRPASIL